MLIADENLMENHVINGYTLVPEPKTIERRVEKVREFVCDNLCKYPPEYKDPDDLWNERCDTCPLGEMLEGL